MANNQIGYRKVGEKFTYGGVKLKCELARGPEECTGCHFEHTACWQRDFPCIEYERQDNKSVIFVKQD